MSTKNRGNRVGETIDWGIDLGTTNSVIAVVDDGDVVVLKNYEGSDTTPSAVWMPRAGEIYVGRQARDRAEADPDNVATEFKLEMGLADAKRRFATAGVSLTPQQLSAEVLKSLRRDAADRYDSPTSAVITVPAAFTLNQTRATMEAAELAGFGASCPLIQEPTAAAFAYGANDSVDRCYWIVFDFGGGTFDAAVVSKADDEVRVLNHAGDPYLGGKLIDWALVDRILAPQAARELGLRDFHRNNEAWRRNFATLKLAAEQAKIQLSRVEQTTIVRELYDAQGRSERFEYVLRRGELDTLAEPFYIRAINLCRKALEESSLDPGDIDRLLLVGGATLAPGLRERLRDPQVGLGIQLDTRVDPSTVVAQGAAIFASTVRKPEPALPPPVRGEYRVTLTNEPTSTIRNPLVTGRLETTEPAVDWTSYRVVITNPGGKPPFRSPAITPNTNGAFAVQVDLDPDETSQFHIELIDPSGARCPLRPDTFTIRHRTGPDVEAVLAMSLGIQLADRRFAPLLRKGTSLPSKASGKFRTSTALRRTDPDSVIRIPIVQGERERGDRNLQVGILEIRPKDVRIDLPAGSEVVVFVEADRSGAVTVVAEVPSVDVQFEATIDTTNVRPPSPEELRARLSEAEQRLQQQRATGPVHSASPAHERLRRIDEEGILSTARDHVAAAHVDVGARAAADERIRDLLAELDDIEEAAELPSLTEQLQQLLREANGLVQHSGSATDWQAYQTLLRRGQDAITSQDVAAIRKQIDETGSFLVDLQRRRPDWPITLFSILAQTLKTHPAAARAIKEGELAIARNDLRELDAVNQRLFRMLPSEEQGKIGGLNPWT